MQKRTIGVVTVGRSDYSIYRPIITAIKNHADLRLALYVSGSHLIEQFGMTGKIIEEDGFPIAAKVAVHYGEGTPRKVAKIMGEITAGFAEVFHKERPQLLLVLGDRFEMHAAAVAAIPFNIPIAHIHGGELTHGVIDDYFRHSLTKLSHLHFAATDVYARRIIQMGEEPSRVFVSGAPGLDTILSVPKLTQLELEARFQVDLSKPVLLTTFHPVTKELQRTESYVQNLFQALDSFKEHNIVWTYPGADLGSDVIIKMIEAYARENSNVKLVKNLGPQGYVSMMALAAAMVGNSSSGIIEAASFKLPVVNIGSRQDGRVRGANVIDVVEDSNSIIGAIKKSLSPEFKESLHGLLNPYGDGHASERILKVIKTYPAGVDLVRKKFHDMV